MSVFTITETEYDQDCRWLFETITNCMERTAKLLTETGISLACGPRYIVGMLAPYSFAGKIRLLWEYARGRKKLSTALVQEIAIDFYRMMSLSPISSLRDVDDEDDDDDDAPRGPKEIDRALELIESLFPHAICVIIMGAFGRSKLDAGKWIGAGELRALTELTPDRAEAMHVESRRTDDGRVEFSPTDVWHVLSLRDA